MGTSKKDRSDRERDKDDRSSTKKRRRDSGEEERESSSKSIIFIFPICHSLDNLSPNSTGCPVTTDLEPPPLFVPPSPFISKYLDPQPLYFRKIWTAIAICGTPPPVNVTIQSSPTVSSSVQVLTDVNSI